MSVRQNRLAGWLVVCLVSGVGVVMGADASFVQADKSSSTAQTTARAQVHIRSGPQQSVESRYWLGLRCGDLPAVVKSQLNLDSGVVVEELVKGSPAEKAGIEQHDIILKLNDQEIPHPPRLVELVNDSQGKEIELTVLRQGRQQVLKVTPVDTPEDIRQQNQAFGLGVWAPQPMDPQTWSRMWPHDFMKDGARLWFVKPGIVGSRSEMLSLLDGSRVRISIRREGGEPAKITVESDGRTWEVTEDKLDQLPEKFREQVEMVLGRRDRLELEVIVPEAGEREKAEDPAASRPRLSRPALPWDPRRMQEEYNKWMEQYRKQMEELHERSKEANPLQQLQHQLDELRQEVERLRERSSSAPQQEQKK